MKRRRTGRDTAVDVSLKSARLRTPELDSSNYSSTTTAKCSSPAVTPPPVHGFHDLPVELLYEIMLFSPCPSLPQTCRHVYSAFKLTTSLYRARYVIRVVTELPPVPVWSWESTVSAWLRFPLCDLDVLKTLEEIHKPDAAFLSGIVVRGIELPKWLFREWLPREGQDAQRAALLQYLFTPRTFIYSGLGRRLYSDDGLLYLPEEAVFDVPWRCDVTLWPADPNSHHGYPLVKAVYYRNKDVISTLLEHGADPSCKMNLAIKLALNQKDFDTAKLLIQHVKRPDRRNGKELLTLAVKLGASQIIEILTSQDVVPDLKTVQMLMMKKRK